MVPAWCGLPAANNTVRNRLSRLSTFLRWCVRHGQADPALVELLASRDKPLRQIPRLYGKVQASQPARRLTHPEAFERLVGACRDGTDLGRQDEAIIRLGLAGMRAAVARNRRPAGVDPHPCTSGGNWRAAMSAAATARMAASRAEAAFVLVAGVGSYSARFFSGRRTRSCFAQFWPSSPAFST
jgi:hypothetical protein